MIKENLEHFMSVLLAVGLVVFAFAHQLQFGTDQYRDSTLIRIEFLFLILSLGGLLVVFCSLIISIFKRKWRKAGLALVSLALSFFLVSLGLFIDSATLIHMT